MCLRWGALLWLLLSVFFITATYMARPCSPGESHLLSSSPFPILAPFYFEQRGLGWLDVLVFPVVWFTEKLIDFVSSNRCALRSVFWCPAEPIAADSPYRHHSGYLLSMDRCHSSRSLIWRNNTSKPPMVLVFSWTVRRKKKTSVSW